MTVWESIRAALKMLGANKLRTGLTMLGIIIGVFAVISLVSLGASARRYVADQFAAMGSNVMMIMPGKRETIGSGAVVGVSNVHKLTMEDAEAIRRRLPSISGVAPVIFGIGLIKQEGISRNTWVTGTGHEYPSVRDHGLATGQFFGPDDVERERRVAAIGTKVRAELFGDVNPLGKFILVMGTPFRVIGVMEPRGTSLGFDLDDIVFIPVSAARRLFNTDGLYQIIVRASSDEEVPGAVASIRKLLQSRHNGEDDITIVSQNQLLATLNTIVDALTFILAGIAAISLVVGGIGIMNIMLSSVSERTREIGLRKALGARSRDILRQFLVESVVLSTIGGLIGVLMTAAAVVAARRIFPSLPVVITSWAVALAVTFSAAIGIFFGVFPARRASRLSPMDALRTE
ncbi:MAG: ABC transporter permease [Candidatus Aminicenantes bacterium]|nr:ABC transporter permease [Candidatus Aminicenantes bacterium]